MRKVHLLANIFHRGQHGFSSHAVAELRIGVFSCSFIWQLSGTENLYSLVCLLYNFQLFLIFISSSLIEERFSLLIGDEDFIMEMLMKKLF